MEKGQRWYRALNLLHRDTSGSMVRRTYFFVKKTPKGQESTIRKEVRGGSARGKDSILSRRKGDDGQDGGDDDATCGDTRPTPRT
jgi:hypothetical protein